MCFGLWICIYLSNKVNVFVVNSSVNLLEMSVRFMDCQVTQMVKNLPAMQETLVRSLHWKDPLEKELAAHSSILAWEISWSLVAYSLWGHKESDMTEWLQCQVYSAYVRFKFTSVGSSEGWGLQLALISTLKVHIWKVIICISNLDAVWLLFFWPKWLMES